jgi:hypothetical protein
MGIVYQVIDCIDNEMVGWTDNELLARGIRNREEITLSRPYIVTIDVYKPEQHTDELFCPYGLYYDSTISWLSDQD